jgi:tRNA (guanine37-N1)-methyltransferase
MNSFRFDILTLFPNLCESYLSDSIIKRALEDNKIEVHFHNIRNYSTNKHKKVDDSPYGGGAGMVMAPQPLYDCITHIKTLNNGPVIFVTPQGQELNQQLVQNLSKTKDQSLIILCGRYEGIDQRIRDLLIDQEISVGQFVLTGGELPALIILDAVTRLLPGVLGSEDSHQSDSFSEKHDGKKKHPVYTKPAEFQGLKVPDVLLSGNHGEIEKWQQNNLKNTNE